MTLDDLALALVKEEEDTLQVVLDQLRAQKEHTQSRFIAEEARARELTSQYVATRRDEEKQLIASDEAVSHALKDKGKNDLLSLEKLLKRPYFARLVVEEESRSPIEYRIGSVGNSDCRIIDWRKAPISKLYFEYKEGDEYSEEIQGRERSGVVRTRNSLDIRGGVLQRISCRLGTFEKSLDGWKGGSSEVRFIGREYDKLPDLLPLITPDQFRTITEGASSAVLIQGIAGSGKTAVALHRLAWLLHEDNSDLAPGDTRIVVINPLLKRYIRRSLDAMGFEAVIVRTFGEWIAESLRPLCPEFLSDDGDLRRPETPMSQVVERVKRSPRLLEVILTLPQDPATAPHHHVLRCLETLAQKLVHSPDPLLDKDAIAMAIARTKENYAHHTLDSCDDALMLLSIIRQKGGVATAGGNFGTLGHLVVDELQDMGASEIECALRAVPSLAHLTLVGDSSQEIQGVASFPGWEEVMRRWKKDNAGLHFVSLTISHRSTLPIMRLADHVQRRSVVTHGRNGRIPIWFHCRTEELGVGAAINWLATALERYPTVPTAVLCRSRALAKEAYRFLAPRFGQVVRLLNPKDYSFDPGITITEVSQVKGLEFMNVMLWNPSAASYPADQAHRNLLYVGVTRAEENVCLVTWGKPSPNLPNVDSKLVRGHRVGFEDEEEQQAG